MKPKPIVEFTAIGKPQPAGSKNAFPFRRKDGSTGVSVADSNRKSKPWQAVVASAARDAFNGTGLVDGPLMVQMVFYSPRPKGHYGTGRNAGKLKASAPTHPTTRPDVLKLARGCEDALTSVIWRDDSQIVSEYLFKRFGEPTRVEVKVFEADNPEK